MFTKLLVATSILAVAAVASAEITDVWVEPVYDGYLSDGTTFVYSFDLKVEITGEDAWIIAGGTSVGEPWVTVDGGNLYQSPVNDSNPPNPAFFDLEPDSRYTSFYTTHLGWPNTEDVGTGPSFAFGPADTCNSLTADWFLSPDGNDYPGRFTIGRFTVVPHTPQTWVTVGVQVRSLETTVPILFSTSGFVTGPAHCPGDLDGDGDVDLLDLATLLANYGAPSGAFYEDGDLDFDCDVDLDDLAQLLPVYGTSCP